MANTQPRSEYDQLKRDLAAMHSQAQQLPSEYDGSLQWPDHQQVLKSQRRSRHAIELLLQRLAAMFAIRPILGALIALGLTAVVLFYIRHEIDLAGFGAYRHYFGWGAEIAGALTIIKSATRSLLLPFVALVIGGMIAHSMGSHGTVFGFSHRFYEQLMLVGVVGLILSILTID